MDPDSIYENTNNKYISLQEAGKGTVGEVTFCARKPSPIASPLTTNLTAQGSGLVAIKIASRELFRDRIATEIIALRRIHSSFAAEDNKTTVKHLPNLVDSDPIVDGGSRWLAVHPILGFDLERLRVVIAHIIQPSSPNSVTYSLSFPAIPEVLVLHIAKQLTGAVGWLHDIASITHNDVFGGNVMLDLSSWDKGSDFTMPTIVLIDFNRARLNPNEQEKGADRSFVYELIHMLDRIGRASSQRPHELEDTSTPKRSPTWWDDFISFLKNQQKPVSPRKVLDFHMLQGPIRHGNQSSVGRND
jgi:serine/threonine protein kinase